jgi:glycolate oxidase iron-sulfur subunit
VAIEKIFPFPERMKAALWPARVIRALRLEKCLPKFLRDALSLIPEKPTVGKLPEISPATAAVKKGRVGFIRGCVMNVLFGETNEASIELLNRAGYDVVTPGTQGCCGALYAHGGNLEAARAAARRNIETFERCDVEAIIINAAGCGSTLKEYGPLLVSDPAWSERGARFSSRVKDLTEWLDPASFRPRRGARDAEPTVTYHDACHLCHAQRITKRPRDLVRAVAGSAFVEMPESDVCCGSAGSYNLTEPEMAERLQRRKTGNILKSGAQIVVTTNPGCLLQIQAGLKKAGAARVEVIHLADYLKRSEQGG